MRVTAEPTGDVIVATDKGVLWVRGSDGAWHACGRPGQEGRSWGEVVDSYGGVRVYSGGSGRKDDRRARI